MATFNIPKYHKWVLIIYALLLPVLFIFTPNVFDYSISAQAVYITLALLVFCLAGLLIFRSWSRRGFDFKMFLYILAFSISEEIIFRGLLQGYIAGQVENIILVVFVSSLIFGLVHLPNGAQGKKFTEWNWNFFALTFPGGIIFGTAYALTGSLFAPTMLHILLLIFVKNSKDKRLLFNLVGPRRNHS